MAEAGDGQGKQEMGCRERDEREADDGTWTTIRAFTLQKAWLYPVPVRAHMLPHASTAHPRASPARVTPRCFPGPPPAPGIQQQRLGLFPFLPRGV